MTASASVRRRVAGLRVHLDAPFVRNAYSLVGSTLATAGFGFVFWIAVARLFSEAEAGRNAALISAMLFLSSISQLNLTNGFNRFVPVAGKRTGRFVLTGYLAATLTALLASTVFVLGINVWAPRLSLLHDHWPYAVWFVLGTVVWTVFALQDAVLTGLGEARWVLFENVIYGVAKLALVVTVAASLPALGVYAAWTAPLIVAVVAVNGLIFRRMVPERTYEPLEPVTAAVVRHYVGFDMVATLMMSAAIGLMPVIMLAILGPSSSAYLYFSWTIAYTLYLVSIGVGMSFVTETSKSPERVVEFARKMIEHSLRIVAPLAVAIALAAPLILRIYGEEYSHHATRLLQLLALSAIPNAVTATYLSITRVQRRMSAVIMTTGALSAMVLLLSVTLAPVIGVAAVGLAWLVAQTVIASVLLLGELRTVWLPYVHIDRYRAIASLRASRSNAPRDLAADGGAALQAAGLSPREWDLVDVSDDSDEVRVVVLHHRTRGSDAVLKVATSGRAVAALRQDVEGLSEAQEVGPVELRSVLPQVLGGGSGPAYWSLTTKCPGVDARSSVGNEPIRNRVVTDLVERISALHRATELAVCIGTELPELLDLPLAPTDVLPTSRLRVRADETSLARLRSELRSDLVGTTVTAARVHGNLWLGNVMCAPDGDVTGIVNWERSRVDLPAIEMMHLICTTRALVEHRELGAVVRDVLTERGVRNEESELLRAAPGAGELSTRTAVLLMWLRHVHGYTRHPEAPRPSHVWVSHNVHQVLESV